MMKCESSADNALACRSSITVASHLVEILVRGTDLEKLVLFELSSSSE